jgi:LysR family hydrogen peroxide-inducible transcriptional activator
MDIGQLRYFMKIVENRSFTRAAQACSVSQPALSQQISKLEKELGQALFERHGRQVRMTRAGQVLRVQADKILRLVDDTKRQIMDDGQHGQICISSIPTIAPYLLPRILVEVGSQFPKAVINIHEDTSAKLVERCLEGEVDIGLLSLPTATKSLTVEPLFAEELVLVLPVNHRLVDKAKICLRDLSHESFVLLGCTHCLVEVIETYCHSRNFRPVATSRIEQLDTVKSLVAQGYGISFIPKMAVEPERRSDLVYRSLAGEKPTRTIAICYHSDRFQTQLLTNFLKGLRECLDNGSIEWYHDQDSTPPVSASGSPTESMELVPRLEDTA